MTNLIRAELLRWVHRRGLWVTLVAGCLVAVLASLTTAANIAPPTEEQVAQAREGFASYQADWEADHDQWYADCLASMETSGEAEASCRSILVPPVESDWIPRPIDWVSSSRSAALVGAVIAGLVALALGASFWGAEFRHGTLGTWLTFAPERNKVWLAKGLVLAVMSAAAAVLVQGVVLGLQAGMFATLQGPVAIGSWSVPAGIALRGLGSAAMVALVGGSLAVLFRNTIAAAAVPVAYLLASGVFGVTQMLPGGGSAAAWLPETNITAYLEDGTTYWVRGTLAEAATQGGVTPMVERSLSFGHGLTYLLVLTAGIALASLIVFHRRDVAD